jgi:cation:H+ antiporter
MPTSLSAKQQQSFLFLPFVLPLLFVAAEQALTPSSPWAVAWTAPCILAASIAIAWGAESAQFFVAQGFALAILAWMQTLPEFAVEAVLAWKQQTALLMANLTGAVRLLTGLAWPMIYLTAAVVHRKRTGQPLRAISLHSHHSVEVVGLFLPLLYAIFVCWKGSLQVYDGIVLIALYGLYLALLTRLPPQEQEGIEDLDYVPRKITLAPKRWRVLGILGCFAVGGLLIYFTAEPFLGSLVAVAAAAGIPSFIVIQWLAPVISEFPELLSTFYFARQEEKAPLALMNIASSNINQWTLLMGMLPVVFSLGHGSMTAITFDDEQRLELLLTIAQSLVGLAFLANMEFSWLEAAAMLGLFGLEFALPHVFGPMSKLWISLAFTGWFVIEVIRMLVKRRLPPAVSEFAETWRSHVRRR